MDSMENVTESKQDSRMLRVELESEISLCRSSASANSKHDSERWNNGNEINSAMRF
jgi:hypothetical protein